MFIVTFYNIFAGLFTTINFDMDVEDVRTYVRDLPPHISVVSVNGDNIDSVLRILSNGHIDTDIIYA